uniref:GYF domain-containing protein n=1 Tax=Setaria viridis TaxID=4556 RepID=A0A4U6VXV6_SETVI|nr:hypothetical protein SEVIR_2G332600v2 [Setaria viridis]
MSESEPEHGPEGPEPEPIPPWPSPSSVSSVLENDDLITVILRHLPPRPSSLPRASLVCKRWRSSATSESFLRDFRAFHRAAPPLLGLFHNSYLGGPDRRFVAAVDPPDRVPASPFRVPFGRDHRRWRFLDCRHGRALLLGPAGPRHEVLVWDPMTGERRRAPLPPDAADVRHGAVLCSCGHERDCRSSHFQVVLVWFKLLPSTHHRRALAAVYSSECGTWSPIITVQVPFMAAAGIATKPGTLAGNGAVYWLLPGSRILEFDAVTRNLAAISVPACAAGCLYWQCQLVLTEAKELGFAMATEVGIMLWKRDSENACGWSMYRSVQLDGRLPPRKPMQEQASLLGFHEEGNAIFVWAEAGGVFMIQLESMQSRLLCQGVRHFEIYPFAGFYTGDATARAHGDDDVDARRPMPRLSMDTLNMWHYEDPQGDLHGPYPMVMLWRWSIDPGFVAGEDFRVWRTDETKEQAVLLTDAMRTTAQLLGPSLEQSNRWDGNITRREYTLQMRDASIPSKRADGGIPLRPHHAPFVCTGEGCQVGRRAATGGGAELGRWIAVGGGGDFGRRGRGDDERGRDPPRPADASSAAAWAVSTAACARELTRRGAGADLRTGELDPGGAAVMRLRATASAPVRGSGGALTGHGHGLRAGEVDPEGWRQRAGGPRLWPPPGGAREG